MSKKNSLIRAFAAVVGQRRRIFSGAVLGTGLLALAAVLFPELAHAAGSFDVSSFVGVAPGSADKTAGPMFFDPADPTYGATNDKSLMLLNAIFASLFTGWGSATAHEGFEQAILYLNAAALTIGGMLAAYTITFGTMATAHEGEMMGKKFSSMWVPIRLVIGTGMAVPLSSYCVAQFMVAWAVIQGVGLANMAWGKFVTASLSSDAFGPTTTVPAIAVMAKTLLMNDACITIFNNAIDKANADGTKASTALKLNVAAFNDSHPSDPSKYLKFAHWGNAGATPDGQMLPLGACGKMFYSLPVNSVAATAPTETPGSTTSKNFMGGRTVADFEKYLISEQEAATIHWTHLLTLVAELQPIADAVVAYDAAAPDVPGLTASYEAAIKNYQDNVQADLLSKANVNQALTDMADQMKSDGWIMAGTWFMRAAYMQDIMERAVAYMPTIDIPRTDSGTWGNLDRSMSEGFATVDSFVSRTSDAFAINQDIPRAEAGVTLTHVYEDAAQSLSGLKQTKNSGEIGRLVKVFSDIKSEIDKILQGSGSQHPILVLKNFGTLLLNAAQGMLTAHVTNVGNGENTNNLTAQIMGTAIILLYGTGATFAVFMPLAPFILFIGAAIAWIILVIEAVFAAPLWAIMKLVPGQDDFMGGGRSGYALLLSLALRPVLMIVGFCCALLLIEPILRFFNSIFLASAKASLMGGFESIFVAIGVAGVYFGLVQTIIWKVFGLIHEIPDNVPKWMGLNAESIGGFAKQLEQGGQQGSKQTAQAGVNAAARYTYVGGGGTGGGKGGEPPKPGPKPAASQSTSCAAPIAGKGEGPKPAPTPAAAPAAQKTEASKPKPPAPRPAPAKRDVQQGELRHAANHHNRNAEQINAQRQGGYKAPSADKFNPNNHR